MIHGAFNFRLRDDIDVEAYHALQYEMFSIISSDPKYGFVDLKAYSTDGQEGVLIATFEHEEGLQLWREQADHMVTQQRGRDEFYEWYWVATLTKRVEFDRENGRRVVAAF